MNVTIQAKMKPYLKFWLVLQRNHILKSIHWLKDEGKYQWNEGWLSCVKKYCELWSTMCNTRSIWTCVTVFQNCTINILESYQSISIQVCLIVNKPSTPNYVTEETGFTFPGCHRTSSFCISCCFFIITSFACLYI